MKVRVIASLVTALCLAFAGTAFASSIGVFFTNNGSDCDTPQAVGPFTYYIGAVLGGDAASAGITGAEFRIEGSPTNAEGWFLSANSEAPLTSVGNPILGGGNIAFSTCQGDDEFQGFRLLYTVTGFASSVINNRTLRVDRHTTPSNPNFPCPLLVLCDAPVFTKLCVPGGEAFINGGVCTVGVEETSWSSVKGLFN